MNLFLIEKYIKKITKNDIYNYANNQGLKLTNKELDTLYYYLTTHYKQFLNTPSLRLKLLAEIKSQVTSLTANKIEELYNLYKNKL